jgi:hypothetical protein
MLSVKRYPKNRTTLLRRSELVVPYNIRPVRHQAAGVRKFREPQLQLQIPVLTHDILSEAALGLAGR